MPRSARSWSRASAGPKGSGTSSAPRSRRWRSRSGPWRGRRKSCCVACSAVKANWPPSAPSWASGSRRQTQQALEESRREAEALREQVARLEPDAAAYAAVKDRSAGVELEAHRRAQGVLDQANSQARHLRQQMEQWMTRVGREYDALRTEVEATISHAADQLDKAGKCLEQVSALLSDQDVALEELSRAYDSTAPDKVPAPVPLEEEP